MLAQLAALSFLALARAQAPASASDQDLALVVANFEGSTLVPDFIDSFSPQGLLNVAFDGDNPISIGANQSQSSVQTAPTLSVSPSENTTDISGDSKYTVILADADVVGTDEKTMPQTRHWLVNGASLSTAEAPWVVSYDGSTAITDYAGPAPPEGSGPHRYVFLIYLQPDSFQAPSNLSTAGTPVSTFFVEEYVTSTGLGALVAANYMQVENGVPTGTIPETTAVDTATLSTAPTGSASASGGGSSSTSRSGNSDSSSAPSASGSGSAAAARDLGWSAIVGGVGVVGAVLGAAVVF